MAKEQDSLYHGCYHGGHHEDIIKDIQVNLMECKVCFKEFETQQQECRPQNLPCGHVLCQECISALSHPVLRKLECPFCRQLCSVDHTSNCQVLSDLQELLLSHTSRCGIPPNSATESLCLDRGLTSTVLYLSKAFGGWGTLINPMGLAVLGSVGTIVVVHDGDQRVVVFSSKGKKLNSFGPRGKASFEICYPLDVAVCPLGYVVVTDGGDGAVKIYTSRGTHMITIKDSFQLPWGVDTDSSGHILVTDVLAGTLLHLKVDYCDNISFEFHTVVSDLENPKAVACCAVTGNVAIVEHPSGRSGQHSRLKVFTKDFHIIYLADSFNMTLQYNVWISMSAVTFDRKGDVIVVDNSQGMSWSLGKPWDTSVPTPLVSVHLIRPVALATLNNKLIILDSGDHAVKIYSAESESESAL